MEIKIQQFNQFYGKRQVLFDINLTIEKGMFGLLGRNGAGKSTLMKSLVTLLPVKSGSIEMAGVDSHEYQKIRSMIGYLPQDFSMYGNMTVFEAMDYLAVLAGLKGQLRKQRIGELLEQVNLAANYKTKVKAMSGGMKRRLGIAQALLNQPQIIIVDEPTAGLDLEERLRFRNLLSEISEERIVLLSTHIASDIEATADHLAIMDQGKIIFSGELMELLMLTEGNIYEVLIPRTEADEVKKQVKVISLHTEGTSIRIRFIGNPDAAVMQHPLVVKVQPTLEDAYLYCLETAGE